VPADWVEIRCGCGKQIKRPSLPVGSIPHTIACFLLAATGAIAVAAVIVLSVAVAAGPSNLQLTIYAVLPVMAATFWAVCKVYAKRFPGKITLPTRVQR
jgi:hypothetical protein